MQRVERSLAQVGDGDHPGQVQRVDQFGFAAERVGGLNAGAAWPVSGFLIARDEAELSRFKAGEFLQGAPVRRRWPPDFAAFPAADAFLVAGQPGIYPGL